MMTASFGSRSGRQPSADTWPAKVILTSPAAWLRKSATDISVSSNRLSFGLRLARQTSCCRFCTVSLRVPVTGMTPNTADCSIDTALGGGWLIWPSCDPAARGHATTAPPSSLINSRYFMEEKSRRPGGQTEVKRKDEEHWGRSLHVRRSARPPPDLPLVPC